jgi:23S rRNA pseudouridine1911/1915/1917 synthase
MTTTPGTAEATPPPEPAPIRRTADAEDDGRRLDQVVARTAGIESRAEAQRLIAAGRVLLDGAPAAKRAAVRAGQVLEVRPLPPAPSALEPEDMALVVPYEDDALLVVDKPAGLVVHPARGHATGTLVHGLLGREVAGGDDPTRPGIVHRLDRDTSGLMVVAKTERAHRRLQRMLRERRVERRYAVMLHGTPPPAMSVDRPIGRHARDRTRMAVVTDGREAITHLRVLEWLEWSGAALAFCEARLETGRTHQIRVHMESAGFPVVGDPVYGRRPNGLGLRRQFLHSRHLAFPHPDDPERRVEVESPLPADLQRVLDRVRGG